MSFFRVSVGQIDNDNNTERDDVSVPLDDDYIANRSWEALQEAPVSVRGIQFGSVYVSRNSVRGIFESYLSDSVRPDKDISVHYVLVRPLENITERSDTYVIMSNTASHPCATEDCLKWLEKVFRASHTVDTPHSLALIHEGVSVTPMISYHLSEDDVVSEETFTRIPEKKVKAGRVL
jgi:hypothetical protein